MRPASFRSAFSRSLLFLALAVSAGGAMAILDRIIVVVNDGVVLELSLIHI